MSKPASPRKVGDKEALAVATTVRGSPQKLNLVAALIRNKKAGDALNILTFSKKAMWPSVPAADSGPLAKVICGLPSSRTKTACGKPCGKLAAAWELNRSRRPWRRPATEPGLRSVRGWRPPVRRRAQTGVLT